MVAQEEFRSLGMEHVMGMLPLLVQVRLLDRVDPVEFGEANEKFVPGPGVTRMNLIFS